jgi:hypothetical protein
MELKHARYTLGIENNWPAGPGLNHALYSEKHCYQSSNPKFRIVRKSIRLIPRGIAQDSLCGYWEHANQFEGPGLHRRRRCQLSEGCLGCRQRFVR